jgi:hypothetical protein
MNTNRVIRLPTPMLLPRPFIPQLLPRPNLSQQSQNQSEQPSYDVKPRLSYIFSGVKEGLIRSLLIVISF